MQHAPSGPPQGLGLQERLGVNDAPRDSHSLWVAAMQLLARLQHAPLGLHGDVAQVRPEENVLEEGQLAAVVSKQTAVVVLQQAPLGPQLAMAQVRLGNQEAAHSALPTNVQEVTEQHAPLGEQGETLHATPAVHVPVQPDCPTVVQFPPGEQQEPARTGLGHGLAVQEPAK